MNESNKVPVLFLIFNRPETTERVFNTIRRYKPAKLFIAADGPREDKPGEKKKCERTRKIVEKIDWPCEVKRLYRDKNLGCKLAVSGAITWFFKNVEEGIVLEDDCLPDATFFNYCRVLLKKYHNDPKIMHIGGNNFQNGIHRGEKNASYYFSKYPHIWGWATWKRSWKKYDADLRGWRKIKSNNIFGHMKFIEKIFWSQNFDSVVMEVLDTWDYQWGFACKINNGLAIIPKVNLITNLGKNSVKIIDAIAIIPNSP